MKPLIVLLSVFGISLLLTKIFGEHFEFALSGRIAMAAMLMFTAFGHVAFTKGMSMMLPHFVPFKTPIIYLTGIIEVLASIGILIPDIRIVTGWFLIIFFILILPANIYAAVKRINYQKGTFDGDGLAYLWFRIPLQMLFIVWTFLSIIKS